MNNFAKQLGYQSGWNNDDFINNVPTYYKDFDCGSKYSNCKCKFFYRNRQLTITLRNKYKVAMTCDLVFIRDFNNIQVITQHIYQMLLDYENNIHKTTP